MASSSPQLIHAAGGLVWRESGAGRQILLVRRTRYGDEWSLPKGKLRPAEDWLTAARREVEEETGYRVRVNGFAGALAYPAGDRHKVVRFWNMAPLGEPSGARDDEVVEIAWLAGDEALARMRYPLERALLEAWLGEPG
jgi:8-oxo-dGTP diphosphatase